MKTPEEMLVRGKGNFINCTDYDDAVDAIKEYVNLMQAFTFIEDGKPEYYKPVLGVFIIDGIEWPLSVWRAWSENFGDIYTISGTDIIANGKPIKWRPIELK